MKKANNTGQRIPRGTFKGKTLCKDCIWIDLSRPGETPGYFYCRKIGRETKLDLNTCCSHWMQRP